MRLVDSVVTRIYFSYVSFCRDAPAWPGYRNASAPGFGLVQFIRVFQTFLFFSKYMPSLQQIGSLLLQHFHVSLILDFTRSWCSLRVAIVTDACISDFTR